jgi:hypothetical protein
MRASCVFGAAEFPAKNNNTAKLVLDVVMKYKKGTKERSREEKESYTDTHTCMSANVPTRNTLLVVSARNSKTVLPRRSYLFARVDGHEVMKCKKQKAKSKEEEEEEEKERKSNSNRFNNVLAVSPLVCACVSRFHVYTCSYSSIALLRKDALALACRNLCDKRVGRQS